MSDWIFDDYQGKPNRRETSPENAMCIEIEADTKELRSSDGLILDVSPDDDTAEYTIAVAFQEDSRFPFGSDVRGAVANRLERLAWVLMEAAERIAG